MSGELGVSRAKELSLASLGNAKKLIESAEAVRAGGNVRHAFGLLTLAAEEIAKAHMYSNLVTGRATFNEPRDRFQQQVSPRDFESHPKKDEWFAELVITNTLLPLIVRRYWVERGPESPVFAIDGFDPADYQSFVEFYTNMDPGIAAELLDPTGVAAKRMDILTSLSLRIRYQKNEAFYVDSKEAESLPSTTSEPTEYEAFKEIVTWILRSVEPSVLSAKEEDYLSKSLADSIRDRIEQTLGKEFIRRDE